MKTGIVVMLWLSSLICLGQKTEMVFEVEFKGNSIGTLHAVEERAGYKSIKDIKTVTDTKLIAISVHVESEVRSEYEEGVLVHGTSYRHANRGSADVHAHINKRGTDTYEKEHNGTKSLINEKITLCIADLFFIEPVAATKVFSNMYAEFLSLKKIAPGKYHLVTPDNKDSYYSYQNGQLVMVESETPVGKVISKRVNKS